MPNQQIESAATTRLSSVSSRLDQRKLRVAGWLIHDDAPASTIMICDGDDALLVDVSLCLSAVRPAHWLRETRAVVMAVGYLEMCERPLPMPVLPVLAPPVSVNPRLILRAIIAQEAPDLDLALWNRAIEAREEAFAQRADGSESQASEQAEES